MRARRGGWRGEVNVENGFVGEGRCVLGLGWEVERFGEEESAEAGFDDLRERTGQERITTGDKKTNSREGCSSTWR